ncbi:uncharacterized protein LOC100369383 [Saccoglossus kowalevskii]|uniref:Uncharacterized protein LOC100369383 n=1 Tax=Saccoglossus kowalevskii TaxID=10224 RepID=A0ABM0GVY0_SACKO|nr:PREDICTED: uncharacterized protein LOC100369383 [Saccoglossus kowalevskii]
MAGLFLYLFITLVLNQNTRVFCDIDVIDCPDGYFVALGECHDCQLCEKVHLSQCNQCQVSTTTTSTSTSTNNKINKNSTNPANKEDVYIHVSGYQLSLNSPLVLSVLLAAIIAIVIVACLVVNVSRRQDKARHFPLDCCSVGKHQPHRANAIAYRFYNVDGGDIREVARNADTIPDDDQRNHQNIQTPVLSIVDRIPQRAGSASASASASGSADCRHNCKNHWYPSPQHSATTQCATLPNGVPL